jgi:hypothetical protein
MNKTHKKFFKSLYENFVFPRIFFEGDLVLVYNQDKDVLWVGKFNPMWQKPYLVRCALRKGAYELFDYEGNVLLESINGLYLKRYYT